MNTERRSAKIACSMALTSLRREGGEGEFLGETFTVQVRQEMAQAWVNLVTPVGQQDKQGGGSTAPRQVMEKVQAGLVTPMQVLNDQQHRLFGCQAEEVAEPGRRRDDVSPAQDQVGAARGDQTAEGADQEARETTQRPGTPSPWPHVLG